LLDLVLLIIGRATVDLNDLTVPVLRDGAILSKLSAHVELTAIVQVILPIAPILIAPSIFIAPDVPRGLPQTLAVVLNDVQFHANRRIIGLDVAITR
jgi:hypothetical protein